MFYLFCRFSAGQENHDNAKMLCEASKGKLFEPRSQTQQSVTESLKQQGQAWIGIESEGTNWVYSSNDEKIDTSTWPGNTIPSAVDGTKECVSVNVGQTGIQESLSVNVQQNQNQEWIKNECNANYHFICEYLECTEDIHCCPPGDENEHIPLDCDHPKCDKETNKCVGKFYLTAHSTQRILNYLKDLSFIPQW